MFEVFDSRRERMALGGLSLCLLMSSLDTSIANASLPMLAKAFGAPFHEAQWIVLAYLLSLTSLTVGAGRLGDVLGRRVLLLTGIALFTLASVVCAAAPVLWVLVAARGVQGMCAATMTALAIALVGDVVPKANAGRAMGQLAAMSAIGTTVGPTIGGLLNGSHPGMVFLVNVPLGILAFALSRRYLPAAEPPPGGGLSFDAAGTALLALTLAAYALAMTLGGGRWSALNSELLAVAVCGVVAFSVAEAHAAAPLVSGVIIRDPALVVSLAANVVVASVVMATLLVGPFYLSRSLALDPRGVGIILSIGPAASALSGSLAGRAVERFGPPLPRMCGLGAMTVGAAFLAGLPNSAGIAGYVAPLIALTAGYAVFQTANNTAVMASIDGSRRGVVAGLLGLSRNLGLITGASAMGAVFLHAAGAADPSNARPEAVAAGMHATLAVAGFLIASVLVVVAHQSFRDPQRHSVTSKGNHHA